MRSISARLFAGVLFMGALPIAANAATTTFGPSAYLQHGDTPDGFACEQCTLVIEDFEDNSLHPFLSMSNGQILPPNSRSGIADFVTDSVDGDDGSVDGNGNGGYSWFSSNVRTVTISFANTVKSAGLVFTDGDYNATNVMLEAFNSSGASIGFLSAGDLADVTYTERPPLILVTLKRPDDRQAPLRWLRDRYCAHPG